MKVPRGRTKGFSRCAGPPFRRIVPLRRDDPGRKAKESTMNDFQMSSLASAHSASLHDEAYRQRIANSGKPSLSSAKSSQPRRTSRLSFILQLRRATARLRRATA
jgi:hypothetical protein